MFAWLWRLLSGTSKTPTKPQGLDQAGMDNQVGEKVVRNRRKVLAKKGSTGAKPKRVRSNDTGKTARKSTGKAVCSTASKGKTKSKAVSKG